MKTIAHIYTDFNTKFGLPRQSGLIDDIHGKIIFEKEYRNPDAFKGLEDFSHIWLIWEFSESKRDNWSPTVRPHLLGGNKRKGVFATRSPFRPNPIGLSCVRLEKIDYTKEYGPVLYVKGCDLMNGTPIYDIKPYLPYCDSINDATGGFTDALADRHIEVHIEPSLLGSVPDEMRRELLGVLAGDPRPSYQNDPKRIYGFEMGKLEIKFKVVENELYVISISEK